MKLTVLGINFRTAPIELRESVSFHPAAVPAALERIGTRLPGAERALLSTCNRTELYVAGLEAVEKDALIPLLTGNDETAHTAAVSEHFYLASGIKATEHLFAVASSLDSMVVGETEVLGQVKQAYTLALQARATGTIMQSVFPMAFRCAKRVHTETEICRGRVSVSSIAVDFAEKVFEELAEKTIMIVGAGETAELALKSLVDRGATEVLVLNRSLDTAQALAGRYGGKALPLDDLADHLPAADIVISSTGAPHCVIRADTVREAVRARRGNPMLLIDIAMPRDIEAAARHVQNVYLYHLDDLQRVADENLARRGEAVDQAWCIVREEMAEVVATFEGSDLRTLMRQFDEQAQAIRDTALERAFAREAMAELPEPARREVEILVQKTINKMLAAPRAALHKASRNGQWHEYAAVVRDLFALNKEKDE